MPSLGYTFMYSRKMVDHLQCLPEKAAASGMCTVGRQLRPIRHPVHKSQRSCCHRHPRRPIPKIPQETSLSPYADPEDPAPIRRQLESYRDPADLAADPPSCLVAVDRRRRSRDPVPRSSINGFGEAGTKGGQTEPTHADYKKKKKRERSNRDKKKKKK